ncbi:shikimate kinase [bacterium]|nr:shikimate kinase [bacterium]
MSKRQHLYLTGYRGTGKSTIAGRLGQQLQLPWTDLDDLIEANAGKSIREIFSDGGEIAFRDLESIALKEVASGPRSVIALGGGAILREGNRQEVARSGVCFWLDADAETLLVRLRGDASTAQRRPSLTDLSELDEIRELLEVRRPLYQQASDYRIDVSNLLPQQVVQQVLDQLSNASQG